MIREHVVFALSSSVKLAQEIVEYLELTDGKRFLLSILPTVKLWWNRRKQSAAVPCISFSRPARRFPTYRLMEDADRNRCACKIASSGEITVIMPYYGCRVRIRKARARQPVTAKLVADLLQTAGASRVVTIDLHATQIGASSIFRSI